MRFRRNPLENRLLETNPHAETLKISQKPIIVSPTPAQAHPAAVKSQARNEDDIRLRQSEWRTRGRPQDSETSCDKNFRIIHKVKAHFGTNHTRQNDLFSIRPRRKNIRLGREGTEGANRPGRNPDIPTPHVAKYVLTRRAPVLRIQARQKSPGFRTKALLLFRDHGGWY